jgi:hypothetical protein
VVSCFSIPSYPNDQRARLTVFTALATLRWLINPLRRLTLTNCPVRSLYNQPKHRCVGRDQTVHSKSLHGLPRVILTSTPGALSSDPATSPPTESNQTHQQDTYRTASQYMKRPCVSRAEPAICHDLDEGSHLIPCAYEESPYRSFFSSQGEHFVLYAVETANAVASSAHI